MTYRMSTLERPANFVVSYTSAGDAKTWACHARSADAARNWFLRIAADMGISVENVTVKAALA